MSTGAHAHSHAPSLDADIRGLRTAAVLVLGVLVVEVVAGIRGGSLALLGDATHLLTDVGSLGLAGYAAARSRRPSSERHTFGYHRSSILVAGFNGTALLLIAVAIAIAAVARLRHPMALQPGPVIAAAGLALLVNGGLAFRLGGAHHDLGIRSAALHVAGDALASAGVVVGAVVVAATGWQGADPVVAVAISALIAGGAIRLLRQAGRILTESTPSDVDPAAVREAIERAIGVEGVHDLHIWSLSLHHRALSAHVIVADRPLSEVTGLLRDLEASLCERFGIDHATLQPECPTCVVAARLYCDLDERHDLVHTAGRPTPAGFTPATRPPGEAD
ncbi:MAG: cation diffusion facilitator family transporter [Candidatus Dormibacteria bacterium]